MNQAVSTSCKKNPSLPKSSSSTTAIPMRRSPRSPMGNVVQRTLDKTSDGLSSADYRKQKRKDQSINPVRESSIGSSLTHMLMTQKVPQQPGTIDSLSNPVLQKQLAQIVTLDITPKEKQSLSINKNTNESTNIMSSFALEGPKRLVTGLRVRVKYDKGKDCFRRGKSNETFAVCGGWYPGTIEKITHNKRSTAVNIVFDDNTASKFDSSSNVEPIVSGKTNHDQHIWYSITGEFFYDTNPTHLDAGDLVFSRFQNGHRLHRGRVARTWRHESDRFDVCSVAYDDGDFEAGIPFGEQFNVVYLVEKGYEHPAWLVGLPVKVARRQVGTIVNHQFSYGAHQVVVEYNYKRGLAFVVFPYSTVVAALFDEVEKDLHGDPYLFPIIVSADCHSNQQSYTTNNVNMISDVNSPNEIDVSNLEEPRDVTLKEGTRRTKRASKSKEISVVEQESRVSSVPTVVESGSFSQEEQNSVSEAIIRIENMSTKRTRKERRNIMAAKGYGEPDSSSVGSCEMEVESEQKEIDVKSVFNLCQDQASLPVNDCFEKQNKPCFDNNGTDLHEDSNCERNVRQKVCSEQQCIENSEQVGLDEETLNIKDSCNEQKDFRSKPELTIDDGVLKIDLTARNAKKIDLSGNNANDARKEEIQLRDHSIVETPAVEAHSVDTNNASVLVNNSSSLMREFNFAQSTTYDELLNSSMPHVGIQFLSLMTNFHRQVPNDGFCAMLIKLMMTGPKSGKTQFPDCHRMDEAYSYVMTLLKLPSMLDKYTKNVGATYWSDCFDRMSCPYYTAKDDEHRMTADAIERIGQSLQLKVISAKLYLALLGHEMEECIQGKDDYHDKMILRSILIQRRGAKEVLERCAWTLISQWIQYGHFMICSSETLDENKVSKINHAMVVDKSRELLQTLGDICSYVVWLYVETEHENVAAVAGIVGNIVLTAITMSDSIPASSLGTMSVEKFWAMLKLKLTLDLDRSISSGLRSSLATKLDVHHLYSVVVI